MDLGEAMYRRLSGGRSSSQRVGSFREAIDWLTDVFPSRAAAARAAGVAPSTLRRWAGGAGTSAERAADILRAARSLQARSYLTPNREQSFRQDNVFVMVGRYTYDSSPAMVELNRRAKRDFGAARVADELGTTDRPRRVELSRYLQDGWPDQLVDEFLAGGSPRDLQEQLARLVEDPAHFYDRTTSPDADAEDTWDVDRLTWGDV